MDKILSNFKILRNSKHEIPQINIEAVEEFSHHKSSKRSTKSVTSLSLKSSSRHQGRMPLIT